MSVSGGAPPQTLRFADKDFWVVPIPGGVNSIGQSRAQRAQLQRYDSPELKTVDEFQYLPLPTSKKRIRLLQLQSGTTHGSEIYCELIEAEYNPEFHILKAETLAEYKHRRKSEAEEHKKRSEERRKKEDFAARKRLRAVQQREIRYEALSWCWGTDPPDYALLIKYNDKTFKMRVRKQLGLALKYLRRPNKIRTLWIDAICINQADHNERNHQVQMMSRIYTRASEVCIWLGEDNDESKTAIDFIHEEIRVLNNFDKLCSDKKYTEKWRALMILMQREWFSRRWVVQEIALASKAKIYCGPDHISWKEFAVAVELFVEVETATHRLSEIMQKDEKFRHVPGWFEHVSELGASLLVQATGKVFRAQRTAMNQESDDPESEERPIFMAKTMTPDGKKDDLDSERNIDPLDRRSLLSLEYLVSTLFIFKATEPRDAVYSMLAIARDAAPFAKSDSAYDDGSLLILSVMSHFLEEKPFVVDYSRPYSDVCRDFVEFTIWRKSKWDPVQALDILCRPWALDPPTRRSVHLSDSTTLERPKTRRLKPERADTTWKRRESKVQIEGSLPSKPWNWKREYTKEEEVEDDKNDLKAYWKEVTEKKTNDWKDCDSQGNAYGWRQLDELDGWNNVLWYFPARKLENGDVDNQDPKTAQNGQETDTESTHQDDRNDLPSPPKIETLPSWVARASQAPFSLYHHPGMHINKTGRSNADPLVGQPQDGHRNYSAAQTNPVDLKTLKFRKRQKCGHYSLYVRGFILDEVETVLDASQGGNIPKSWLDLGGWDCDDSGHYQKDPPDHFWRTLVGDRGRDNRNPPYYYATACKESIQKGGIASGRVATADLINNERNSIVAEFCRRVQAVIWGRRLFKTKKHGVLGLCSNVQRGDKIAIIYGCTVPVVLTEKSKENLNPEKTIEAILKEEAFDDSIEALKFCLERMEKNLERKARYQKKKEEKIKGKKEESEEERKEGRKEEGKAKGKEEGKKKLEEVDYEKYIQNARETAIGKLKELEATSVKAQPRYLDTALDSSENSKKVYYEFNGEAYVHGMMDGEALRMKFYDEIPDVLFELR
ncbi:heterokaryon incompatibility protein-domain-containing protein [Lasiosphaeria hispida]|uniref:Heterokaryon incompatibility protein-domain-containing protein n=1 Tax=Lasiosphaeria hispida TaxID=260671 RepID=A0AAJ0MLC6_9PEZI|nr:heterokaryon incompatibility protein-domain-containing protein [Lasiosphaeria hispida]